VSALDDCFAFPERRLLHAEAVALLQGLASPIRQSEWVDILSAPGRVSAETVTAPRSIPAHTNAAVDGYTFAFESYGAKEGTVFSIAGRAAAGEPLNAAVPAGSAARIFTGAIMPQGCDTVAMQEDCRLENGSVFIPGGLKRGANRRLAGEDVAEGAPIIMAGQRLRPQDAAALAASGRSAVSCVRRPRLCIFSTGNEVLSPGSAFEPGKVYDANGPMLSGLFVPLGLSIHYGGILPDRRHAVHEALHSAAREADLLITSGGASLGEEDHVIAVLNAADALSLWQLAIKPGRPMGVGKIGSCLCFALPGNPVAVMVCALLYVWPVARCLAGEPWIEPRRLFFPAGFEIAKRKQGRREFFRGWLEQEGGRFAAKKYPRDGSGLISSLRAASGLIEIPEDVKSIQEGDSVAFIPFSEFGIFARSGSH
jgi:molybdopterin molybdotransferase